MVGFAIILVSTVGFGTDLNTVPIFNRIGGDDNVLVDKPDANITMVLLTESGSDIGSATITVKNTDSRAHSYNICVITKAGASISDTVGTSSDCNNSALISASSTGSTVITFTTPLTTADVDAANISVQQIT